MTTRQIFIESLEFELKVSVNKQHLHLVIFHRISQRFYSQQYNNNTLPYLALSLFNNITGLFKHLEESSHQQSEIALPKHLTFEAPKLTLISYACGGQKKILIDFQLNAFSQSQNYLLLEERLSKFESEERILSRKWQRLNNNYQQQKSKESSLIENLREIKTKEDLLSKMYQQKTIRLQQLKKIFEQKKHQLNNLINICQQHLIFPQKDQQLNPTTLQFIANNQDAFQITSDRALKVRCDLALGKQKLVSRHYVTPHTTYQLSICTLNLNFDIVLGISNSFELGKVGAEAAGCVALSIRTQSLYVCGIQFFIDKPIQMKPQSRLNLILDRISNTIEFINNDQRIISLQIPAKMSEQRLHIFLCLGPGDEIRVDSCSQINIYSE